MTDVVTNARAYLARAGEPCGNDACIGEWAAVHGRALLDEVERLRELPQQIADAVSQMQAEDFSIDDDHQDMWVRLDDVNGVIARVAEGRVGDDSLWFTGAEWQAALKSGFDAMTERDDLQTEVERLRADAELGRLVREVLPLMAVEPPANHHTALICWGGSGWDVFYACDDWSLPDTAPSTTPEDALRSARENMEQHRMLVGYYPDFRADAGAQT